MANDFTINPWTLDTVVADFTDLTKVWGSAAFIDHFEFVDYTLDTDACQIVDRNGKVIWEGNGESDFSPVVSGKIGVVQGGIRLAALTNAASRVRVYMLHK